MSRSENIKQIVQSFASFRKELMRHHHSSELSIPHSQYEALFCIYDRQEITIGELANNLRVTPGAATQLADALVKSDYILRSHNDSDRRVVNIMLSEKGKQTIQMSIKEKLAHVNRLLVELDDTEVESLADLLGKVSRNIQDQGGK